MIETLLIVFVAIVVWMYSWTFTAHGRIEFLPALICRVAALASRYGSPVTYSESDRASANASTVRLMNLPATPGVIVRGRPAGTARSDAAIALVSAGECR